MNGQPTGDEALCRWCGKRLIRKPWAWIHKASDARQCELFATPAGAWGGRA